MALSFMNNINNKRLILSLLPSSLLLRVFYLSIIFTTLLLQAPVLRVESLSIPFLVEKVDKELISEFVTSSPSSSFQKNDLSVFDEISDLCVSVFFNGDDDEEEENNNGNNNIAPWKAVQLNHLRKLQFNDLKKKKNSASTSNMFIAREVLMMDSSTSSSSTKSKVLDLSQVTNAESLSNNNNNNDYCLTTGKVIGFCQVSISHIGIATSNNNNNTTNTTTDNNTTQQLQLQLQPRLTNLAVDPKFRESGIGSKLLSLCEETILSDTAYDDDSSSSSSPNNHDKSKELYLQVEEDNKRAISFYLKRNYETIYSDPTTRRYDTNGLFLRNLRSTKITMKKILQQQELKEGTNVSSSSSSTVPFFFAS